MTRSDDTDAGPTIDRAALAAADWRVRQPDLDAAGWRAFADWLEADPRNAAAMARLDAGEALLPEPAPAPVAMTAPPAARWRRQAGLGGALAAALALLLVARPRPEATPLGKAPEIVHSTTPGTVRPVALADGSRVTLNGGSSLSIAGARTVRLGGGQAFFAVAHAPGTRFTVSAGDVTITDIGTRFDVSSDGGRLVVAVAEGAVAVARGGGTVVLRAGQRLQLPATGPGRVTTVPAASVGSWQGIAPTFAAEPLENVVATIGRRIGATIRISTGLRGRPFTGTVRLTGDAARDVPHLALLIGADAAGGGTDWKLLAGDRLY